MMCKAFYRIWRPVLGLMAVCLLPGSLNAQRFGGNRSGIKWMQIKNDAVRVIYPKGQDSIARRVATLSELLANQYDTSVGPELKKIDIVLQSENILSNAYVGLGPYRSEFYMTPPQDPFRLGANSWADQLAIHELRHAQQFSNFNTGLSKIGTLFGGQLGRAVANNMAVPDWFWEGDAVWSETVHTGQGRGRIPFFFNTFKSLEYGDQNYSWMKLRNGSFKNLVPNHYELGYLLVAYGRERYGNGIWQRITEDAAAFKGLFYPMQKAVERHTGQKYMDFTGEALADFRKKWAAEAMPEPGWITGVQKNNVINYRYPYPAEDGSMIALKTSYRQIPVFVKVAMDGREEKIAVKDIGYDDYFSYRNGSIVYTARQPDARWGNREYSVIRHLNIYNGVVGTVSTGTKYFSPDISANGESIVAVQVEPGKPAQLHVMDLLGEVLYRFTADSSLMYSHPKWLDDGQVVVAARQPDGQMGWLKWQPETSEFSWLLPPANRLIGFPVVQGDTIIYTNSANGVDALQYINAGTGSVQHIRGCPTGLYQGFMANDGKLVASVFTDDGYRLGQWEKSAPVTSAAAGDQMPGLYQPKTLGGFADLSATPTRSYEATKYRKSFRLLNFHSWLIEPNEPDYTLTFLGENILSTLSSELYYRFNTNERSHKLGTRFLYGGSYVQPFVSAGQTWGREVRLNQDTTLIYNETEAGLGLQLPLNLSFGKSQRFLTLSTAINTERVRWAGIAKDRFRNLDFNYWNARLVYTSQIQRAVQHIYPRLAQTLIVDYRTVVNEYTANQFLASGALYLPGLHINHNLVVTGAFQGRDTLRQYIFGNSFPFSRGYNSVNFPRMWRLGVNYHFPLFYPDWGFANILYLRRVRANAFYDYTAGKSLRTGLVTPFGTTGGELFFDMNFWNVQPATLGFRYSYLLNFDLVQRGRVGLFEVILPVNLFR